MKKATNLWDVLWDKWPAVFKGFTVIKKRDYWYDCARLGKLKKKTQEPNAMLKPWFDLIWKKTSYNSYLGDNRRNLSYEQHVGWQYWITVDFSVTVMVHGYIRECHCTWEITYLGGTYRWSAMKSATYFWVIWQKRMCVYKR